MKQVRDFKVEYQRRIARAAARGLSRSQGRGHARSGEAPLRSKPIKSDERLEAALKLLRQTRHQGRAAKAANVSPERLRRFLRENALAERRGRSWHITDTRPKDMKVVSNGAAEWQRFRDFDQLSLNGEHLSAVGRFLETNDIEFLRPFEGLAVRDAKGKAHPLETDPNALYRLAASGSELFHEIYRLVQ